MGNCIATKDQGASPDKKTKMNIDGAVQHRKAAQDRVSQDEIALAEVKSRINKV